MVNIFGNRYEDEILYQKEFEQMEKEHPNFRNIFTVSRPKTWKGESEYVQFVLKKHVKDHQDKHIYICGVKVMIDHVLEIAHEIGFQKEQIFYEKYD